MGRNRQPSLYYVYTLIDETGEVFYVGKGKGNRAEQHMQSHILRNDGSLKGDIIRYIRRKGGEVKVRYLAYFEIEQHAFVYEAAMIKLYGLEHLANKSPGIHVHDQFKKPYNPLGEVEYMETRQRDTDFNRYAAHYKTRQPWEDFGAEIS